MHGLKTLRSINARNARLKRERERDRKPAEITVGALSSLRSSLAYARRQASQARSQLHEERTFQHWRSEALWWKAEAQKLKLQLKMARKKTR